MPALLARFYSFWPLVTYEAPDAQTPAPSVPTLWLAESSALDFESRSALALARFATSGNTTTDSAQNPRRRASAGIKFDVKRCASADGAPDGLLPALHLPNGDLVSAPDVHARILTVASKSSGGSEKEKPSARQIAFQALLDSEVRPAVHASLFVGDARRRRTATASDRQQSSTPWLRSLVDRLALEPRERSMRLAELCELLLAAGKEGGAAPSMAGLMTPYAFDVEALEAEAQGALTSFEEVVSAESDQEMWLLGASGPTKLDASLFALLELVHDELERSAPLRVHLTKRCPALLHWLHSKREAA